MYKKLLVVVLVACSTAAVKAQKLQVGIKAGATINKIDGASFKDKFTFGYHAGGFVKIKLSQKLALQPEVLFNQTNVDTSNSFSSVYRFNNFSKVQLNQLVIPLLLNYSPNKLLSLQVGPQYAINTKKELTLLQNGQAAFKGGDFAMVGGVQINLGNWHIYGRYNIGLSNLNDIDNREKWKTQQAFIGIGMKL
jgi:hypothetical protein